MARLAGLLNSNSTCLLWAGTRPAFELPFSLELILTPSGSQLQLELLTVLWDSFLLFYCSLLSIVHGLRDMTYSVLTWTAKRLLIIPSEMQLLIRYCSNQLCIFYFRNASSYFLRNDRSIIQVFNQTHHNILLVKWMGDEYFWCSVSKSTNIVQLYAENFAQTVILWFVVNFSLSEIL
jgi:hypothetical protein